MQQRKTKAKTSAPTLNEIKSAIDVIERAGTKLNNTQLISLIKGAK